MGVFTGDCLCVALFHVVWAAQQSSRVIPAAVISQLSCCTEAVVHVTKIRIKMKNKDQMWRIFWEILSYKIRSDQNHADFVIFLYSCLFSSTQLDRKRFYKSIIVWHVWFSKDLDVPTLHWVNSLHHTGSFLRLHSQTLAVAGFFSLNQSVWASFISRSSAGAPEGLFVGEKQPWTQRQRDGCLYLSSEARTHPEEGATRGICRSYKTWPQWESF